jgi:hypothetical protein
MLGIFYYPEHPFQPIIDAHNRNIPLYIKEIAPIPSLSGNQIQGGNSMQMADWITTRFTQLAQRGIPIAYWNHEEGSAQNDRGWTIFSRRTGEWNMTLLNPIFLAYGRSPGTVGNLFNTVYSLSTDPAVQNLSSGTTGNAVFGTNMLSGTGGNYTIVPRTGGGNAIQISERAGQWYGILISRASLNLAASPYRITVNGRVTGAAANASTRMMIGAPDDPWSILTEASVTGNNPFTLSVTVSNNSLQQTGNLAQFNSGFRIQTAGTSLSSFIIDDIIIERHGSAPNNTCSKCGNGTGALCNACFLEFIAFVIALGLDPENFTTEEVDAAVATLTALSNFIATLYAAGLLDTTTPTPAQLDAAVELLQLLAIEQSRINFNAENGTDLSLHEYIQLLLEIASW